MNPFWFQFIRATIRKVRLCPHCGRRGVYPVKKPGEYHVCKFCQHSFQETPSHAT